MSEEIRPQANPAELWMQWYQTVFGALANPPGGRAEEDSDETVNPYDAWRQWTEATTETWRKAAEVWTRMARLSIPRWAEMSKELQKQMLDGNNPPVEPMDLYKRWYNAASGPMSELADDVLRDEAFLDFSRRLLDYYAIFDSVFGRAAEEYFANLRLPTSSDTDRIAGLVVALDDKVERTEETLEEEIEEGYKETAGAVEAIEQHLERVESRLEGLDRLESKLDQLLAAQDDSDQ